MQGKKLISIIIPSKDPSRTQNLKRLLDDISQQKIDFDIEICQVQGVSPSGKARNKGARDAKGEILIFMDDDIRLGHEEVLKNIITSLLKDAGIGICGVSQCIPKDSNWFQRRYAKEIPHSEHIVVSNTRDVGIVAVACCALYRDLFFKIGMFHDGLPRGVDPEFCSRVLKSGNRVVLAGDTWIYHPAPKDIKKLFKVNFRDGMATFMVDHCYPELNFDVNPKGIIYPLEKKSRIFRILRFCSQLVYSAVVVKPILLLSKLSYASGYLYGILALNLKNVE